MGNMNYGNMQNASGNSTYEVYQQQQHPHHDNSNNNRHNNQVGNNNNIPNQRYQQQQQQQPHQQHQQQPNQQQHPAIQSYENPYINPPGNFNEQEFVWWLSQETKRKRNKRQKD